MPLTKNTTGASDPRVLFLRYSSTEEFQKNFHCNVISNAWYNHTLLTGFHLGCSAYVFILVFGFGFGLPPLPIWGWTPSSRMGNTRLLQLLTHIIGCYKG